MAEKQRWSKKERLELGMKIVEMKKEGYKENEICAKLGIAKGSIYKLKTLYLSSVKEEKPNLESNLFNAIDEALNGKESVKMLIFPIKKTAIFNSITIYIEIQSGLEGEEREIAIEAALREQIRFQEVKV